MYFVVDNVTTIRYDVHVETINMKYAITFKHANARYDEIDQFDSLIESLRNHHSCEYYIDDDDTIVDIVIDIDDDEIERVRTYVASHVNTTIEIDND